MKLKNACNRKGFTTGTCAQAAAKAAALMLTTQKIVDKIDIETPNKTKLNIGIIDQQKSDRFARATVIKDSGDDPDITDKAKICAEVRLTDKKGIVIKGGRGVGKATLPGLAIPVGDWAINPTPRKMIFNEVSKFVPKNKGLEVTISVPEGRELAKKTFNPQLGIIGGISIIGTTGIVEPKSESAYKTSLSLQLDVLKAQKYDRLVLILGYVGEKYYQDCFVAIAPRNDTVPPAIKIGDHVGFMLKECAKRKIREILLIGHIGKLVKIAAGQFNTNYKFGDNRVSTIFKYAKICGANNKIVGDILKQKTAEATIDILRKNRLEKIFPKIASDVSKRGENFVKNEIKLKCIILSLNGEVLSEN